MKGGIVESTIAEIATPEGVPLRFEIAPAGDRIVGLAVDLLIFSAAGGLAIGLTVLTRQPALVSLAVVFAFVLFQFGFVFFEMLWQGQTPGKRIAGIRVIDRHGGALRGDAVFVRNLTRTLETLVPVAIVSDPTILAPGAPPSVAWIAALWAVALAVLPLCNRRRLRAGDLLAGTMVVKVPKVRLLADLGKSAGRDSGSAPQHRFTREQLSVYGIYELQVLEDLLRRRPVDARAVRTVTGKIRAKIRYEEPVRDSRRFLEDFYAAQRAALERELLFGQRRERKVSETSPESE